MNLLALGLAYLSVFAFACLDALVGYLTNILGIPVYQILVIRTVSTLPTSIATRPDAIDRRPLHLLDLPLIHPYRHTCPTSRSAPRLDPRLPARYRSVSGVLFALPHSIRISHYLLLGTQHHRAAMLDIRR